MALGTRAGGIYLDLNLNKKGFQTQLGGIQKIAAKAGAEIAGAFAATKLIQFGKECIDLGSDLAEVQNVVDVAFPNMSSKIDDFAKNAAEKFGLSETMAKRFTGTFGSMAEAFGFSEKAAADMATTLTGLAGDVASFYNISQDEAYTKLKSVFTGETESLKDLGVVMTQAALDQYALANGFGKTTSAMTEAEKVSLRYAFVQDQLTNAAGDFIRTSDSWANQIRLLSLQFDSLKAAIGEGLINVLKPVVQWLNLIIKRLIQAAQAFAKFTSMFSKKGSTSSGASNVASDLSDAAGSSISLGDSASGASSGLSKAASAAKKLKRELAGFDQITKLGDQEQDSDSGSGGSGGSAGGIEDMSAGITSMAQETADAIDSAVYPVIEKIKQGFKDAFRADTSQLEANMARIKKANKAVWNSPEVKDSMKNFKLQAAETLGAVTGSVASVATSFSVGMSGGIASAKEDLVSFNKTKTSSIFDNLTSILETIEGLADAASEIATAFEGPGFQKIVEVLRKIGEVTILSALDFITGIISDLIGRFKSFSDNAEGFRLVLEDIFDIASILLEPIENVLDKISGNAKKYQDGAIHKFFENLQEIHSAGVGKVLEKIHEALSLVKAVLEKKIKLGDIWKKLFPYFFGNKKPKKVKVELGAQVKQKWNDIKKDWTNLTKNVKEKTADMKARVATKWNDIRGSWNGIISNVKDKTADMKARIATKWSELSASWSGITNNIKDKLANMRAKVASKWSDLSGNWNGIVGNIKDKYAYMRAQIASKWSDLKWSWQNLMSNFKDKTVSLSLKFSAAAQDLKDWINTNVIDKINTKFSTVPILKKVKIPHLAQGGYVKANTPQLALIGDNRHQGEVVAPEDKLLEMARKAATMSGEGNSAELISLLRQILQAILNLNLTATVDVNALKKLIVRLINDHTRATGVCEIEI